MIGRSGPLLPGQRAFLRGKGGGFFLCSGTYLRAGDFSMTKKTRTLHNGKNGETATDETVERRDEVVTAEAVAPVAVRRVRTRMPESSPHVMQRILKCLTAVQKGTFSVRLPG